MSRNLEPILLTLIPTHSTALPQPLVDLASSLLAQSRHSAATLKAEEDVARSYACCHIACERLKTSLDLPPIQPRPPIPPRIYKRLYTHLENILPASTVGKSGRIRTPTSKLRESGGVFGSDQRVRSRATPNKEESLAKFRPSTQTPTRSTGKVPPRQQIRIKRKAGGVASALPAWTRPTIQLLCHELNDERIGRTVLAGMQTIVAPHGKRTKDDWVNNNLTALLAAVYCLVSSKLFMLEEGKDLDDKQYAQTRKSILAVLEQAQEKVTLKEMDEDELWIGWKDIGKKDVDAAVAKVTESGWQNGDWFTGIQQIATAKDTGREADDVDMEDAEADNDERISQELHIRKPDTMLQSRWSMTDQKIREYREWKEDMLRKIEEAERELEAAA